MTAKKKRRSRPDPIFAAIESVRQAEITCDNLDTDKPHTAFYAGQRAVVDEFFKARSAFAKTVPPTRAGLLAFASYVNEAQKRMCGANPYFDCVDDAEAFAITLETAVHNLADR